MSASHSGEDAARDPYWYSPDVVWDDPTAMIYKGDCIDVMAGSPWPAHQFDLAFADPPYNFGMEYDGYSDDLSPDGYKDWCRTWWEHLRFLARAVIVTPGHGNLPMWFDIDKPSGIGCWYKPGGTGSSFLGWCEWEPWLYWGPRLGGGDTIKATLNPTFKSDVGHPCPKPVELLKGLLLKTKTPGPVLDPFMGSGTTLVAARALGLVAVGIEQSERYCEVAANRLTQTVLDFGGVA